MEHTTTARGPARQRLLTIGFALAATVPFVGLSANAASASTPLPTPTRVVVSQLTAQSFRLNIGGAAAKLYSVHLNGRLAIGIAESSATISFPVNGLTQHTDYTVRVQQIVLPGGRTSALSAPLVVHTPAYVPPARPAAPTDVRVTSVTADSANLTWTASATPGVTYVAYLNGEARPTFSTATAAVVGPIQGFPNPIPNTGLRAGRPNRVGIAAVDAFGVSSPIAEITVTSAGTATPAPTAPTNLTVTSVGNNAIGLAWTGSSSNEANPTVSYRFRVDGVTGAYTCSQYCFGATGGIVGKLAPGTTYRIGVEAIGYSGAISDITEITATTSAP